MTTIEIKITKDEYGLLRAENNGLTLFPFQYREEEGAWYFWVAGRYAPTIFEGRAFPTDFFTDACRATAFITRWYRGDCLPEGIKIVKGISYIR